MVDEIEEVEESTVEEVVEQVEEATTETVEEVEETEEVAEEEEKPEKKAPIPKGVQKRIDKITRQKHDAERHIQDLQRQLDNRPEAQPTNTERPTLEQFDFDDGKYIDALTDWKVGEAMKAQYQKGADQQRQNQQGQVLQEFEAKRQQTLIQGVTAYDDFEEVAIDNPNLTITPQMADIITDSPLGHEIAYHLGSNTEEASKIASLTPLKQAAAIARIEAQLSGKTVKKISNAPKPVKPVGAKGSSTTKLDPKKDWKKWAEARNKEQFGR